MTHIKVRVYTEFFPAEVSRAVSQAMLPRLMQCGFLVEGEAKRLLNKGGGTPRKKRLNRPYEYYNPMRRGYVLASIPPAPPHTQTGNLKSSVTTAPTARRTVLVGPTRIAKYGRVHEFGKRPFMRVALQKMAPRFPARLRALGLAGTPAGRKLNGRKGRKLS